MPGRNPEATLMDQQKQPHRHHALTRGQIRKIQTLFMRGRSVRDIADAMGLHRATVERRLIAFLGQPPENWRGCPLCGSYFWPCPACSAKALPPRPPEQADPPAEGLALEEEHHARYLEIRNRPPRPTDE